MNNESINRIGISVVIIILLSLSLFITTGVGDNIKYNDKKQMEDIAFYYNEKFGSYKTSFYQEFSNEEYFNNRIISR